MDTGNHDARGNWHAVLALWSKVVKFRDYNFSDLQFRQQIKPLIAGLLDEKDCVKKRYPERFRDIDIFIADSNYIKIVIELAGSMRPGGRDKKNRAKPKTIDFVGQLNFGAGKSRRMYCIESDGKQLELFEVLLGAIEEYERLEIQCRLKMSVMEESE